MQEYTIKDEEHFFMTIASVVARRSDCIETNGIGVGACIVNEKKQIVGIGCNKVNPNSDDIHAEVAAINNASLRIDNCTLYVTRYPCYDCAVLIKKYGIKRVFYNGEIPKNKYASGRTFLQKASIPCEQYRPPHYINIDYSESKSAYINNMSTS